MRTIVTLSWGEIARILGCAVLERPENRLGHARCVGFVETELDRDGQAIAKIHVFDTPDEALAAGAVRPGDPAPTSMPAAKPPASVVSIVRSFPGGPAPAADTAPCSSEPPPVPPAGEP